MDIAKNILKWLLLAGGLIFWIIVIVTIHSFGDRTHVYDCSIAEISPDYPIEVKEQCRKIRSGKSIST